MIHDIKYDNQFSYHMIWIFEFIMCLIGGNSYPMIQHTGTQRIGWSVSWKRPRRHSKEQGPGQRQQTLWREHLDVSIWQGPPPDGVHCWGWKNQEQACQREQDHASSGRQRRGCVLATQLRRDSAGAAAASQQRLRGLDCYWFWTHWQSWQTMILYMISIDSQE